jgi:hypothetical protein
MLERYLRHSHSINCSPQTPTSLPNRQAARPAASEAVSRLPRDVRRKAAGHGAAPFPDGFVGGHKDTEAVTARRVAPLALAAFVVASDGTLVTALLRQIASTLSASPATVGQALWKDHARLIALDRLGAVAAGRGSSAGLVVRFRPPGTSEMLAGYCVARGRMCPATETQQMPSPSRSVNSSTGRRASSRRRGLAAPRLAWGYAGLAGWGQVEAWVASSYNARVSEITPAGRLRFVGGSGC